MLANRDPVPGPGEVRQVHGLQLVPRQHELSMKIHLLPLLQPEELVRSAVLDVMTQKAKLSVAIFHMVGCNHGLAVHMHWLHQGCRHLRPRCHSH